MFSGITCRDDVPRDWAVKKKILRSILTKELDPVKSYIWSKCNLVTASLVWIIFEL